MIVLKKRADGSQEGAWERCALFDINFQPDKMTSEELQRDFIDPRVRLYRGEFTEIRRRQFDEPYKQYLHQKATFPVEINGSPSIGIFGISTSSKITRPLQNSSTRGTGTYKSFQGLP